MTLLSVRNLRVGFGGDPKSNEVVKGVSFQGLRNAGYQVFTAVDGKARMSM